MKAYLESVYANEIWEMSPTMVAGAPLAWTLVLRRSFPMPAHSCQFELIVGELKQDPVPPARDVPIDPSGGYWGKKMLARITTMISYA